MQKVLTDGIWDNVANFANGREKHVAVAFVTDLGKLKLGRGDVLICDASDRNVSAGVVDRDLLAKLFKKGVNVIHCASLHAKCARFGRGMRYTLIGSSNLSVNSSETLEEIALMTDNPIVGSKVDTRFHEWIESGEEVDGEFIKRIMKLPRAKRYGGKGRKVTKRTKKNCFGNRIWVVGSSYDDYTEEEQRVIDGMEKQAEKCRDRYKVARRSALQTLIWWGGCAFVREVVPGDLIVEIIEKEVSLQVVLAVERRAKKVFCYTAPVNGLRSRTFKQFNKALGIPVRMPVYKEDCSRLLLKRHIPLLSKLWKRLDVESLLV